jgi:hypothetical protein
MLVRNHHFVQNHKVKKLSQGGVLFYHMDKNYKDKRVKLDKNQDKLGKNMFKSNSKHNIWKKKTQNMQTKSANKKLF